MNFKLDENLGPTIQEVFVRGGHDCRTVREQNLGGEVDERVLKAAVSEGRILVTMDHDFGNVLVYPPDRTAGIAIVSPPGRASRRLLRALVEAFLAALRTEGHAGEALDRGTFQNSGARARGIPAGIGVFPVLDRAIQLHRGAGVSQEFFLASAWADSRTLRFADGPDEVHRRQIGRLELRKHS